MKNWMITTLTLTVLLFVGCSKYTTPRKVEKRLVEGSWKISTFTVDGISIGESYSTYIFSFGESGGVSVKGGVLANGNWEMGLIKDPAVIYLSFPAVGGLEYLADDWQVLEMKKDQMRLKRNDSSGLSSTLVFKKTGS